MGRWRLHPAWPLSSSPSQRSARRGDHIVASSQLYGGTVTQLDVSLRRFGIETTFVEGTDPADYKAALTENTKAIYTEVVANPSGENRRPLKGSPL